MITTLRNSNKHQLCLLLLICGLAFFAQEWYFISDWDDVFYKYIVSDPTRDYVEQFDDGCHQPIRSIGDIFFSQWNHYLGSNGRYLTHCLEQFFDAFVPRQVFAVLNSLVFTILLWVMMKLADKKMNIINCLLVVVALFTLCPHVFATYWANISLASNYLWAGVANLAWYLTYENFRDSRENIKKYKLYGLCLSGIIAASLQESYSLGICAGLGLYYLVNIKRLKKVEFLVALSYFIGTCLAVFAPSNFMRAGKVGVNLINLEGVVDIMQTYIFIVLFLACVISALLSWKKFINFLKDNIVLLTAFCFAIVFALHFYIMWHQLTMPSVVGVILLIRLTDYFDNKKVNYAKFTFLTIGGLFCVVSYIQAFQYRVQIGNAYYNVVDNAYKSKAKVVVDTEYEKAIHDIEHSFVKEYFLIDEMDGAHGLSVQISDGKDMFYLDAVIPVTQSELEQKMVNVNDSNTVVKLINNIYVCRTDCDYDKNIVFWNYKTVFHNPKVLHDCELKAQYKLCYKNKYYYIFRNRFDNPQSVGITIKK